VRRPDVRRFDLAIAATVAIVGVQEAWFPLGPGFSHLVGPAPALALVSGLAAVALLWRRSAPLAVSLVVNGLLASYCLVFGSPDGLVALVPVVFSLYAVGRYGDLTRLVVALLAAGAGSIVHEWRDPQPPLPVGPQLLFFGGLMLSGLVGQLVSSHDRDVQALSSRAEQLAREREDRAREAVIAERSRIAHELHDLVGHGLSLIVLQVVGARGALDKGQHDATGRHLERLEATARNTLAEMRRLVEVVGENSSGLAPPPSIGDIPSLVDAVRGEGLPIELEFPDTVNDLPTGIGLTAYRIVQEGLTNVMKHAGSGARTRVIVTRQTGELSVDVLDTGVTGSAGAGPGRGLAGMRERIVLYGGTLEVGPTGDGGFRLHAWLPLDSVPA
jgi:signal transduction histidine kinase